MQYLFNYVYDRLINEAKKQEKIKNPLKYRGTGPQGFRSDVSVNKIEGKPPVKGTGDSDIGGAVISGWKRRVMLLMTLILTDKETAPKFNKLMERSGELIRLASGTSKILSKYQDELSRIESLIDVKKEEGKKVLKEKGLILGELKHPSLYNIINFIELYKDELLTDKSLSNRFKKMLDNNTSFTDEDKMAAMDAFNEYVQEGEGFDYMMDQIKDIGQKERYTGARDSILTPERKKELQKKLTGGKEIVKGFKQETATKRGYKKERGFVYDTSQEGGVRELPLKKQEIERVNKGINNIISQLKIDIDKLEVKRQKIYNLSVRGDELAPKRLEKVAKEFPRIIDVFKFLSTKAGENLNETFDTIEFGGKAYTLEDLDGTNIPEDDAREFIQDLLEPERMHVFIDLFVKSQLNQASSISMELPETPDTPEQPKGEAETSKDMRYVSLLRYLTTIYKTASNKAKEKGYYGDPEKFIKQECTKLEKRLYRKSLMDDLEVRNPTAGALIRLLGSSEKLFRKRLVRSEYSMDDQVLIDNISNKYRNGQMGYTEAILGIREITQKYDIEQDIALADEVESGPEPMRRRKLSKKESDEFDAAVSGVSDNITLDDDLDDLGIDGIEDIDDDEDKDYVSYVTDDKGKVWKHIDVNKKKKKRRRGSSSDFDVDDIINIGDIEI